MSRKVYLSTYIVDIYDKEKKETVNLSKLKNGGDIHSLFKEFIIDIASLPFKLPDFKSLGKGRAIPNNKSLGMKKPLVFSEDSIELELFGMMNSGLSGRKYPIHNVDTGDYVHDMERHHAGMLDIFFKTKFFENRKYGLFILERQGEFGIKKLFTRAFNDFLVKKGLLKYELRVNNFMIGRIFDKLIADARIFEVSFIKNQIQDNIVSQYDEGYKPIKGTTKTIVTAGKGGSIPLRNMLNTLFKRNRQNDRNGMVRIERMYDEYDEVDFELEFNGTRKTLHMSNVGRSLPDYDVTENIDFDPNTDEPTLFSLNKEADKLLMDMIEYYNTKA